MRGFLLVMLYKCTGACLIPRNTHSAPLTPPAARFTAVFVSLRANNNSHCPSTATKCNYVSPNYTGFPVLPINVLFLLLRFLFLLFLGIFLQTSRDFRCRKSRDGSYGNNVALWVIVRGPI